MPEAGEYFYSLCVGTKAALILGGGGITGAMYELGALSAMDDFIVSGRKSGDFDLYVGISAGSILAAFLANGITISEMCSAVLGEGNQGFFLRREDIYELPLGNLFHFPGRSLRSIGSVVHHIRKSEQPVTFLNILAVLQQYLPAGFFSNANLERYVERTLSREGRTNDFRTVRKPLAIVATEIDTAERWIFGEGGRKDIPISKAIQASTAIPVFFEPVLIEERYFVDGAAERVHALNYGYNSSVYYFIENFDMLRECFSRHGMEVSLERLIADRFLQQAVVPAERRRFGLIRQKSTVPAR